MENSNCVSDRPKIIHMKTLHAINFFLAVIVFKNNQIEVNILRQKRHKMQVTI